MIYKYSGTGKLATLIVYVNDIILIGDDVKEIEALKGRIATDFRIKDLRPMKYFIGIELLDQIRGSLSINESMCLTHLVKLGCLDARQLKPY
jgi:hypothetical protein